MCYYDGVVKPQTLKFTPNTEGHKMRKILKEFDRVWSEADEANRKNGRRFERCFSQTGPNGKYLSFGIYDTQTKRYALLDTINLSGNFRYNSGTIPDEIQEMRDLVRG